MNQQRPQVLIVEDEIDLLEFYVLELEEGADYDVHPAQTVKEAQAKLAGHEFAVVLTDLKLRAANRGGLAILDGVKKASPTTQVIVFTGIGGTDDAREAERLGADGYLAKPLDFDRLRQVVKNAIATQQQLIEAREKVRHRREKHLPTPERFVYGCSTMSQLVNAAARLAGSSGNLLIVGEPGTGKGLLAEGIHFGSQRAAFELVNCGSLSERTLERIIFGWLDEDTGNYHSGLLERLSGGTLVLDRVSDLSLRLQEKLLEALSAEEYYPHDSVGPIRVDVRILSMSQFDLRRAVDQGLFLADLYGWLAADQLVVPPLRDRRDPDGRYKDVLILAEHFIKKYGSRLYGEDAELPKLAPETEYILEMYPFPNNVRELQQAIRLALGGLDGYAYAILPGHLPAQMQRYGARPSLGVAPAEPETSVLCPHGMFRCNQTAVIAMAYHSSAGGVYLRLAQNTAPDVANEIRRQIERLGRPVFPPDEIRDSLTPICEVCVPIQSSHCAIVDVTSTDQHIFYELGLLHALGVPTLILKKRDTLMPDRFSETPVTDYADAQEIGELVRSWLLERTGIA